MSSRKNESAAAAAAGAAQETTPCLGNSAEKMGGVAADDRTQDSEAGDKDGDGPCASAALWRACRRLRRIAMWAVFWTDLGFAMAAVYYFGSYYNDTVVNVTAWQDDNVVGLTWITGIAMGCFFAAALLTGVLLDFDAHFAPASGHVTRTHLATICSWTFVHVVMLGAGLGFLAAVAGGFDPLHLLFLLAAIPAAVVGINAAAIVKESRRKNKRCSDVVVID